MGRYIVEHRHTEQACPAKNPQMAPFLLKLLSDAEAKAHGVTIHGDAVARGKHHLYLIVDSSGEAKVREYLAPFAQAGSLDVIEASSCEEVVRRGAC